MRVFIFETATQAYQYGIRKYIETILTEAQKQDTIEYKHVQFHSKRSKRVELKSFKSVTKVFLPQPISHTSGVQSYSHNMALAVYSILDQKFSLTESDIFHFNGLSQYELIKVIKKFSHCKILYVIHAAHWEIGLNRNILGRTTLTDKPSGSSFLKYEKEVCQIIDKLICLNNDTRNFVIKNYQIPDHKIQVIENGIVIKEKVPNNLSEELLYLREQLNAIEHKIVLYIGRISAQKGILNLLEAFKEALNVNSKIKLVVIGDGELLGLCLSACQGFWKNIIFTGFVPNEYLDRFYDIADLAVFPSFHEQGSYSLLEAINNRVPTIVTNIKGFKMLKDKHSTYKVPLHAKDGYPYISTSFLSNCIIELLENNKHTTSDIAQNAFDIIKEKYSSTAMFKKYRMMYEKLQ